MERWAGFPPQSGEGRPGGHLWSPPLSPPGSFPLTEGFAKAFLGEGCGGEGGSPESVTRREKDMTYRSQTTWPVEAAAEKNKGPGAPGRTPRACRLASTGPAPGAPGGGDVLETVSKTLSSDLASWLWTAGKGHRAGTQADVTVAAGQQRRASGSPLRAHELLPSQELEPRSRRLEFGRPRCWL